MGAKPGYSDEGDGQMSIYQLRIGASIEQITATRHTLPKLAKNEKGATAVRIDATPDEGEQLRWDGERWLPMGDPYAAKQARMMRERR